MVQFCAYFPQYFKLPSSFVSRLYMAAVRDAHPGGHDGSWADAHSERAGVQGSSISFGM